MSIDFIREMLGNPDAKHVSCRIILQHTGIDTDDGEALMEIHGYVKCLPEVSRELVVGDLLILPRESYTDQDTSQSFPTVESQLDEHKWQTRLK